MSNSSVQNISISSSTIATTTIATTDKIVTLQQPQQQQLSTISIMLDYDIDNTLNTIKENGAHLLQQNETTLTESPATPTPPAATNSNCDTATMSSEATREIVLNGTAAALNDVNVKKSVIRNSNTSLQMKPLTVKCDDIKAILPLTPPATPVIQNTARKRWKILAKVLRKDSEETVSSSGEECINEQTASVRRFKSFDLLRQDSFEDHGTLNYLGKPENWYKYKVILDGQTQQEFTVNIHHMERHLTATDLMGFNNTGNICVWPSEEALTAFVLSDLAAYNNKWILELGGGFTCLSGLMLSKYAKPFAVHLTDGNEVSVENVKKTVCLNEISCYTKCSVLKWEDKAARVPSEAGKFDIILSADCLFFDEARSALVDTVWYYLSPQGEALIMAPRRGKTMSLFIEESMARGFMVKLTQRYNETIWKRHLELMNSSLYDEDLHYPVLLSLRKSHKQHPQHAQEIQTTTSGLLPMDVCKEES
ncbi:calmodulin-lysine N-methyltransferase [Lucilia sericata]|uniref:calmodulin-lysine N-methyltransferase n=1 Tax=Lucilia sericata TaxID=13632 RepID=UPI0018A88156|nr:calmodulin-lysine N-methyltransferase [Lucilia sericata]